MKFASTFLYFQILASAKVPEGKLWALNAIRISWDKFKGIKVEFIVAMASSITASAPSGNNSMSNKIVGYNFSL